MSCMSCGVGTMVEEAGLAVAQSMFASLAPGMLGIGLTGVAITVLVNMGRWTTEGRVKGGDVIAPFVMVAVGTAFLEAAYYQSFVYEPVKAFLVYVSGGMVGMLGLDSMQGLLERVEGMCWSGIKIGWAIIEDSLTSPPHWFGGLIVIVPFFIFWLLYVGFIGYAGMVLLLPVAFGPVLVVAGMFKITRKVMVGGLDLLISATATAAVSSFWAGIAVKAVEKYGIKPGQAGAQEWWAVGPLRLLSSTDYLFSENHLLLILVSWVTVLFVGFTPSIVSYFSGKIDTSNISGALISSAVQTAGSLAQNAIMMGAILKGRK